MSDSVHYTNQLQSSLSDEKARNAFLKEELRDTREALLNAKEALTVYTTEWAAKQAGLESEIASLKALLLKAGVISNQEPEPQ